MMKNEPAGNNRATSAVQFTSPVLTLIELSKTNHGCGTNISVSTAPLAGAVSVSSGNGSSIHLSGELYKHLAQVSNLHVPYRGGAAALTDLMGGQLDLMFDNLPTSLPHIAKGSLRPLAVTGPRRSPLLPEVPTMVEAGVPGYESTAWSGIFVPAGTPAPVVQRLHDEVEKALQNEKVKARYRDLGADILPMPQPAFDQFVRKEYDKWAEIVRVSGAKAE